MPDDLLKRIIEQASDSLAEDVYQRILVDRRAERGQMALHGVVSAWEELAARAEAEGILNQEEATRLVARAQGRRFSAMRLDRRRPSKDRAPRRTPDRPDRGDDAEKGSSQDHVEGSKDSPQSA